MDSLKIVGHIAATAVIIMLASQANANPISSKQISEAHDYIISNLGGDNFTGPVIIQNDKEFNDITSGYHFGYPIKSSYTYGVIYLRENFDAQQMPLLVHEMTHYWQQVNGIAFACDAEKEKQAYSMQNKYAKEHSLPSLIMSDDNVSVLSKCRS